MPIARLPSLFVLIHACPLRLERKGRKFTYRLRSFPTNNNITKNGKNISWMDAKELGLARTRTGDLSQLILLNPKRES
jgi:hypothetical protein